MAIDPSIPLGVNNAGPQFDFKTLADLMQMGKQRKTQNALKAILSDPKNLDQDTGMPNAAAVQKVIGLDPKTGLELVEKEADLRERIKKGQDEEFKTYQPLIKDAKDAFANRLNERIGKVGLPAAVEELRGDYKDTLAGLSKAGVPDRIKNLLPQEFTPSVAEMFRAEAISPEKRADIDERKTRDDITAKTEQEREKHDRETERLMGDRITAAASASEKKGWNEYQDEKGIIYRDNPNAGLTQKKVDGKWEDVDQLPTGLHKPGAAGQPKFDGKMGELMAALAEQGVALPTGFRSKEQQVALYKGILERNPNLSADDIATKLKTGQIEFGAQKKETQTAAGVAGKVEVAENEIQEFVPLVREASKKVDRGKFVPINKLMQMVDSSISDPDLKELKVYINSTLNAYDMLAARGGTDKDKRAENRALLLTAESPEALERGLAAFEKEAAAAHRAAVKATKVPELPGAKASPEKGGQTDHSKMSDDELKKMLGIP